MKKIKTIYLAGGCFWGLEKFMEEISGVLETSVGYANGQTENPTYDAVCSGNTGFAETVKVIYDADVISLEEILKAFFDIIDPTSVNRQGNDRGSQYRTGIYYDDDQDILEIDKVVVAMKEQHEKPIVTEIKPLNNYYEAEAYHQKYLDKNPNGYCHIPKWKLEQSKHVGL